MRHPLHIQDISDKAKFFYDLWHGDGFTLGDIRGMYRRIIHYVVDGAQREMPMVVRTHAGLKRFDLHIYCPGRMSLTITYKIQFPNPLLTWEGACVDTSDITDVELHIFQGETWADFEYDFLMAALGYMTIEEI